MKKFSLLAAFFAVFAFTAFSQAPKEIKGGILNGKAMMLPKPEYPEAAKTAGIEGVVYVDVTIDEEGNVVAAVADDQVRKVYKQGKDGQKIEEEVPAADVLLRDAALRAAWTAKFSPTRLNGSPVRVTGTIVYNFVASESDETKFDEPITNRIAATEVLLNSKAISLPKPDYPPAAKAVRAEGTVNVQVTVNEEGTVISAVAVSGHPLLRAPSVKAAREAKFSPSLVNGEAVKFTGVVVYNFVAPSVEN